MRCGKCDGCGKVMTKSGVPRTWQELHEEGDEEIQCDQCFGRGVVE